MKKVLWFSRHEMTSDQLEGLMNILGDLEVSKINGTAPNVHVPFKNSEGVEQLPLKELVQGFDEAAMVLPINLQQQILPFLPGKRILVAKSKRIILRQEDGSEEKVQFVFDGWQSIKEIKIVIEDL